MSLMSLVCLSYLFVGHFWFLACQSVGHKSVRSVYTSVQHISTVGSWVRGFGNLEFLVSRSCILIKYDYCHVGLSFFIANKKYIDISPSFGLQPSNYALAPIYGHMVFGSQRSQFLSNFIKHRIRVQ